jgi:glutamyl-tRNA reductase
VTVELFVVGLSWRTAPVAVREKLAVPDDDVPRLLADLRGAPGVSEVMLISTCNRVEIYGVAASGDGESAVAAVRKALPESRGVPPGQVAGALYSYHRDAAAHHVFRVAAALDSLVVGEAQILGQLKAAHGVATGVGAIGAVLGRCLERAFGAAKRVRRETAIAKGAANVASVSVELAARVFGDLAGKRVLVIGAGKMSSLAARHLRRAGVGELVVTNRSSLKAHALAAQLEAIAQPWERLEELLAAADVVISSTGAREPVLTVALFKRVTHRRRWKPMIVIDIAVPRDADPAIGELDGVYVFDIDDLEKVVASNLAERRKAADAAERIVAVEVAHFGQWLRIQKVVPTIRALRHHVTHLADFEVDKLVAQLACKDLTAEGQGDAVRRSVHRLVAKLLHHPQMALKGEDAEGLAAALHRLFPLELVESGRFEECDDELQAANDPAEQARAVAPGGIVR